jgi:hypothetical protein
MGDHVHHELEARVKKLEDAVFKTCVYEPRSWHGSVSVSLNPHAPVGMWCQTHGWHCPNNSTA